MHFDVIYLQERQLVSYIKMTYSAYLADQIQNKHKNMLKTFTTKRVSPSRYQNIF